MEKLDKLVVLKKLCVAAALPCPLLWVLAYFLMWNGWAKLPGMAPLGHYCLFGLPVAFALLLLGYYLKQRRAAVVLCAAGLVLFAAMAVVVASGAMGLHNVHFQPFAKLDASAAQIEIWQGRDEDGSDIWLKVDEEADYRSVVLNLTQLDCYWVPQDGEVADKLAALDLQHPAWHFRIGVAGDGGNVWRVAICGGNYCILSKNGEDPQAYEVRPIYYENWNAFANSDLLWDYEYLLKKYAE